MNFKVFFIALSIAGLMGCVPTEAPLTIDLQKDWIFNPDPAGEGVQEKWYSMDFDDSSWKTIDAGQRWEDQGFPDLDGDAWYRKVIDISAGWKGKNVWIKFGGVNDAYELFVNGESVTSFGQAHISFADKPSVTGVTDKIRFGGSNLIAVKVNDWGNSGGLWRLPVVITTDEKETELFKPLSETPFDPEKEGYELFWHDELDGDSLDTAKWAVRAVGPRASGFITPAAVEVTDGFLKIHTYVENDSVKTGAVGTQARFETTYGYFECRAQLQKSTGNWSAFWIQSPYISRCEDPGECGVEIDIFEYFKKQGGDFVSHNLHWAYGPNQQSTGAFLSKVEGVGEGFHTFAVEWTPEKYAFFIDGIKYHEVKKAISHIDEYIILSMELPKDRDFLKEAKLPDVYVVDYVRVYKKKM